MTQPRPTPCPGCPFRGLSAIDALEAVERGYGPCEMLCHESGCLDGDGPDLVCKGFEEAMEIKT